MLHGTAIQGEHSPAEQQGPSSNPSGTLKRMPTASGPLTDPTGAAAAAAAAAVAAAAMKALPRSGGMPHINGMQHAGPQQHDPIMQLRHMGLPPGVCA